MLVSRTKQSRPLEKQGQTGQGNANPSLNQFISKKHHDGQKVKFRGGGSSPLKEEFLRKYMFS